MGVEDACWAMTELSRNTAAKAQRKTEDNITALLDDDPATTTNWYHGTDFDAVFNKLATDQELAIISDSLAAMTTQAENRYNELKSENQALKDTVCVLWAAGTQSGASSFSDVPKPAFCP